KAKEIQLETFDLSAAERVVRRDIEDARVLRADLVRQLATGQDVRADLDTVESEIEQHMKQLARFDDARSAAAQADTAKAKAKRHEECMMRTAEALADAAQLGDMAKEVL